MVTNNPVARGPPSLPYGMDSKNIERVIVANLDLYHHSGKADESGEKADYHCPKRFHKACGRGDGD
jgi:hypothetical protein